MWLKFRVGDFFFYFLKESIKLKKITDFFIYLIFFSFI